MADYRSMYEELGMDVELHEQLMAGFSQMYPQMILDQPNRPKA